MKYALFLFPAILLLAACSTSKNADTAASVAMAPWQTQELVINGSDSEWVGSMAFYNEKLKLGYTISNDRSNLYLRIRTTDPLAQQQILRGGLTVLINPHGVKDEHGAAGISFPTGNLDRKNEATGARMESSGNNPHIALSDVRDYSLYGFNNAKTVENYDLYKPNPDGVEVAIGMNPSNALIYEARVPFTAIFNPAGAANAPGRSIAIELVLDDIPSEQGRGGRGSGVSVGGGFGFGSFGSGGGLGISIGTGALGGGGGRGGKLKQLKTWKEIVLARDGK